MYLDYWLPLGSGSLKVLVKCDEPCSYEVPWNLAFGTKRYHIVT